MFDIGWSELLLIGIVALIVVGPKDLPKLFHALGQFTSKARNMARDFQRAMEQAAREAGGEDVANMARDLRNISSPKAMGLNALDAATKKLDAWDQTKRGVAEEKAAEKPAEMGPATAELAEQVRANSAAAEARAAEIAAFRDKPTPEELAEVAHEPDHVAPAKKPASRARKPVAAPAEAPAKPKRAAPKPEAPAEPAAKPKRAAKPAAAAEAAAKAPRKRKTAGTPDA